MSYAVRNTIILLVTLFLLAGSVFSYIKFYQEAKLEELHESYTAKQQDLNSKRATSDAYPEMNRRYQQAVSIIENYDKSLFPTNNPDDVFDYLNEISNSPNSRIFFDFSFSDSTAHDQYGIIRSNIQGYANYSNFLNFINKLENSQLLNKVKKLSLVPPGGEELADITFTFTLESYYERIPIQENIADAGLTLNSEMSHYNPFYPLILSSLPANEDNLINIEQSRIIGLTGSRVFVIDQNGKINALRKGDEVYLGYLESINMQAKSATFNLNKGGITELVTLEIER